MQLKFVRMFCLLAVLVFAASAVAQEGHPLTGTWYGDFGTTPAKRSDLTVIMTWDGKVTNGPFILKPTPRTKPAVWITSCSTAS